jgi:hypothetical protein
MPLPGCYVEEVVEPPVGFGFRNRHEQVLQLLSEVQSQLWTARVARSILAYCEPWIACAVAVWL